MPNSGYFDIPFAENGDLNTIPDATQSNGTVSYNQGFPVLYSTPVGSGGYNVPRTAINQALNDITTAIQAYQQFGVPPFITSAMNGGSPFPYAQYATVLYSDGHVYQSLVGSNATTPAGTPANWALIDASGSLIKRTNIIFFATAGSYTYTPTAGLVLADVTVHGGGGGGGGGHTVSYSGGCGGSAGGWSRALFSAASIGGSRGGSVGGQGAPGAAGSPGVDGGTGGTTTFSSLMTATGGLGGGYGTITNAATPQAGGTGTGGAENGNGSTGTIGYGSNPASNVMCFGGAGGAGLLGGSGYGGTTIQAPSQGTLGSGGGGGCSGSSGAYGGVGFVQVVEYLNH